MWKINLQKWHLFINYKFTNPWSGHPDARTSKLQISQIWICKFVNNKHMAFLQFLFHNNYCFIFKTSVYNVDLTDCVPGQTDLWLKGCENFDLQNDSKLTLKIQHSGNDGAKIHTITLLGSKNLIETYHTCFSNKKLDHSQYQTIECEQNHPR